MVVSARRAPAVALFAGMLLFAITNAGCTSTTDASGATVTTAASSTGTPTASNTTAAPNTTTTMASAEAIAQAKAQQAAAAATLAASVTSGPCDKAAALPALQVDTAVGAGADVQLKGHSAQLVCGGPSDSHFSVGTNIVTVTIPASMTVSTIELTAEGIGSKQRVASELPAYLPTDMTGHWFVVESGYEHPTGIAERFQA
jgi:hypothetical protein